MFFDSLGPLLGAADEPEPTPRRHTPVEPTTAKGIARAQGTGHYRPNSKESGGVGINRADAGPPFPPQGLILDEDGDPLALDVNPAGFEGSHFATFAPKLVRPLILAGTSEKGCCGALVPKLRLRGDLTDEQRARVYARLGRKGIV